VAKILVVEDDGALRFDLSEAIVGWGHDVRATANGREGFEMFARWRPDIVVSDINMPVATGYDLLSRVQSVGATSADVTFLFLTSMSAPALVVKGIEIGADDYITKPVNYRLLKAKIDGCQRRTLAVLARFEPALLSSFVWGGLVHAWTFTAALGALGIIMIFIVYWIKTVLGINIFEDWHFTDLF
jgi:DNA-binding response OmpR family regulator